MQEWELQSGEGSPPEVGEPRREPSSSLEGVSCTKLTAGLPDRQSDAPVLSAQVRELDSPPMPTGVADYQIKMQLLKSYSLTLDTNKDEHVDPSCAGTSIGGGGVGSSGATMGSDTDITRTPSSYSGIEKELTNLLQTAQADLATIQSQQETLKESARRDAERAKRDAEALGRAKRDTEASAQKLKTADDKFRQLWAATDSQDHMLAELTEDIKAK